jgi:WD40 repeat protein
MKRGDQVAFEERLDLPGVKWRRGSAGRRLCLWSRTWTVLILGLAIVVPWIPFSSSGPALKPSLRIAGASSAPITNLTYSDNGQSLATTDDSGRALLWQVAGDDYRARVLEYRGRAQFVASALDERCLAIAGDAPHVALWDIANRNWAPLPQIRLVSPSEMKVSPDGRTLAVASYDSAEIVLWDVATARERWRLTGHRAPVMHMAFAPDGRSLASAAGTVADAPIRIWNLATGRPERVISRLSSAVQAMAYSPDGNLLAGACPHDRPVRIWDVRTGGQVQVLAGHSFSTRSVAFSPDGRLLATAAGDGTGGLWSVATGHQIRRLDGEADVLRNVAFSPDGRTLVATGNDGDIRVWDVRATLESGNDD